MTLLATGFGRSARAAVVVGLLLASAACTGSSDQDDAGDGTSSATAKQAAPTVKPGKYRVLPEPCGAVSRGTLRSLIPDNTGATAPAAGEDDPMEGKATLTFDTDRRAGCRWVWRGEGGDTGGRALHVDFERVVSYDSSVSDEQQAEDDYLAGASRAGVPTGGGSSPEESFDAEDPSSSDETMSPRLVGGVGEEAFMTERVAADAPEPHRDIRLMFREDNVIVTVEYQEWPGEGLSLPSSSGLQRNAHMVAQDLAKRLSAD